MVFNILIEGIGFFLKFDFSKNCCLSIFKPLNFLRLGIRLLDSL